MEQNCRSVDARTIKRLSLDPRIEKTALTAFEGVVLREVHGRRSDPNFEVNADLPMNNDHTNNSDQNPWLAISN